MNKSVYVVTAIDRAVGSSLANKCVELKLVAC